MDSALLLLMIFALLLVVFLPCFGLITHYRNRRAATRSESEWRTRLNLLDQEYQGRHASYESRWEHLGYRSNRRCACSSA